MHALIIEKDNLIADAIAEALAHIGFELFDFAQTEVEAVALAEYCRPDLITADVHLARGSGIGAVHTVCADRTIPTVFTTTVPQEVLRSMPDAVVLSKPFGEGALRRAVVGAIALPHSLFFIE